MAVAASNWTRPEDEDAARPVYVLSATVPGSDLLGSASAALAAVALTLGTSDGAYAASASWHAEQLYQ